MELVISAGALIFMGLSPPLLRALTSLGTSSYSCLDSSGLGHREVG